MRRVVLDTNVVVSALLSPRGNAAKILEMVSDGLLETIYCCRILSEYEAVLCRPRFPFTHSAVVDALDTIRISGIMIEPLKSYIAMRDESDRIFFDTAVSGNAALITGNLKHYPEAPFIFNPAGFLANQNQFMQ